MSQISQHVSKALVSLAMEQSLLEVGPAVLNVVSNKIFEKYQCYVSDCYDHPEYLNTVLDDMHGPMRHMIIELIRNQLEEFSYQEKIQKFLEKLNYGLNIDSDTALIQ